MITNSSQIFDLIVALVLTCADTICTCVVVFVVCTNLLLMQCHGCRVRVGSMWSSVSL